MTPRDHQRARVYAWEDRVVAPADRATLPFTSAEGMVRAIWAELGLRFPPAVERLPRQSRCLGEATRLAIRLPGSYRSWCLLHELAHSLTSTHDGASDGHGARFMGVYLRLLATYLRLPHAGMLASAVAAGITVDATVAPVFVDAIPDRAAAEPLQRGL